jgi:hypothetical protein
MHHDEECLFVRIFDCSGRRQDLIEEVFNLLGDRERNKGRPFDAHRDMPQPSRVTFIRQEVVRENRVKIEDGVTIEADFIRRVDQKLDGILWFKIICASSRSRP